MSGRRIAGTGVRLPHLDLLPRPPVSATVAGERPGALAADAARGLAVAVLAVICGLVVWSLLPVLVGWKPQVVLTGSMAPRIVPGDLVLAAPAVPSTVTGGQVVLFEDPAHPGRSVVHRVVRRGPDGFVTRGDANAVEDSTPVPESAVRGLPRLRVPLVGLPSVWLHEQRYLPLGLVALGGCLTAAALVPGATTTRASGWLNDPRVLRAAR